MADSLTDQVDKFEEAIGPFKSAWASVDVRAIADLKNNSLLSMIACLTPDEPRAFGVDDQIGDIAFIRGALPINGLNRFLAELKTGGIALGGKTLQTQEFQNAAFNTLSQYADDDFQRAWPEFNDFGYFKLLVWGRRNLEAIVDSNKLWAAAVLQGFSGFPELALNRVQFEVGGGKSTRVHIFAPVLAKIEGQLEPPLSVCFKLLHHEGLRSADFAISYRVQNSRAERLAGDKIECSTMNTSSSPPFVELSGSLPLPPMSSKVELLAFYHPYKSGLEPVAARHLEVQATADGENPRWRLLQSIMSNTRAWTKGGRSTASDLLQHWLGLSGIRPDDQEFERGVHSLLFLSGLNTMHLGAAEGLDLATIETSGQKIVMLISCTTSPDVARKVSDLKLQVNRVKETLSGFTVVGAVLAPAKEQDITIGTMELVQGEKDIYLVLQSSLREMFAKATSTNWREATRSLLTAVTTPKLPRGIFSHGLY